MGFEFGQSTLEVGMAIALTIVLIVATVATWSWFNKTMVERMDNYKASRYNASYDMFIHPDIFGQQETYNVTNLSIFAFNTTIE